MTFEKLEKNLMDVVLEEQAKLGFRREKIRLYYPLSTLNHLLGTQDTAEQMEVTLAGQPDQFIDKSLLCKMLMSMSILQRRDLSMN